MDEVCGGFEKKKGVKYIHMFKPEMIRKESGLPVLSKKQIDDIGIELVRDFNADALVTPQAIDIDLFAQDYLGVNQDFAYLSHCGIYLGMTVFNDTRKVPVYNPQTNQAEYISAKANTIIIDNTLLASNQEHRYRFTMGHEVGHQILHKDYFSYMLEDICNDINSKASPIIKCKVDTKNFAQKRAWTDIDWLEWQANSLASSILMPKPMVNLIVEYFTGMIIGGYSLLNHILVCKIANVFNVSTEAATIRLKNLGHIQTNYHINREFVDKLARFQLHRGEYGFMTV